MFFFTFLSFLIWKRRFKAVESKIKKVLGHFSLKDLETKLETLIQKPTKLEEVLNTYNYILDEMPVGVLLISPIGKIIFSNRSANKYFLSSDSRRSPLSPLTLTIELSQAIKKALTGEEKIVELELKKPKTRLLRAYIKPIFKDLDPNGAVVVLEDISEVKKFEKLKQSLVSDFSHELRTPLTSLKTSVESLYDFGGLENPEVAKKFLGYIKKEVDNLSQLVDKMMQLARLESESDGILNKSYFKIQETLQEAIEAIRPQAEEKKILIVANNIKDFTLFGDNGLIRQSLINVMENAVKYSPQNSKITILNGKRGKLAWISIVDEGPGIPKKEISKIFRRFYRGEKDRSRSKGGFGLGLSLVKHIIEAHGGKIKVKSEFNKGTEVILYLPL